MVRVACVPQRGCGSMCDRVAALLIETKAANAVAFNGKTLTCRSTYIAITLYKGLILFRS